MFSFESMIWLLPCSLSLLNTRRHGNGWPNSHSNVFTYLGNDQTGKEPLQKSPPVLQ